MSYQANLAVGSLTLSNVPAGYLQTNGSGLVFSSAMPTATSLATNGASITGAVGNGPNTLQVQGAKTVFNDGINPRYTTILPGLIDVVSATGGARFIGANITSARGVSVDQTGTVSSLGSGDITSTNANTGDTAFVPDVRIIGYDSSNGLISMPVLTTTTGLGTVGPYQLVAKDNVGNILPLVSNNDPAYPAIQIGAGGVLTGIRDFATILTPTAPTASDSLVSQPQITPVGALAPLRSTSFSGTTLLTFPANSGPTTITNVVLNTATGATNQYYNIKLQAVGAITGFPLVSIDATIIALYGTFATGGFEAAIVTNDFGFIAGTTGIPTNPITGLALTSVVGAGTVTLTISAVGGNFETKTSKVDVAVSYV